MSTVRSRTAPYVWVTWISKLMVGEQLCEWASWFRTHYRDYAKAPSDFNLTRWTMEHTDSLREARNALDPSQYRISVEQQNSFKYPWEGGILLAGKPDLLALPVNDPHTGLVIDCKTGQPKMSDRIQVMLYMHCLPRCHTPCQNRTLAGRVLYADHVVDIPPDAIDEEFVQRLDRYLRLVAGDSVPPIVPSASECRFCDITRQDCRGRMEE